MEAGCNSQPPKHQLILTPAKAAHAPSFSHIIIYLKKQMQDYDRLTAENKASAKVIRKIEIMEQVDRRNSH